MNKNFFIKTISGIILLLIISNSLHGQCSLNLIASEDTVFCGRCVTLSAFGSIDGNVAFGEDFNSGSPQGWQFTQSVTLANNTCGVPAPDGTDFMWMGDDATNPRDMTTNPLDLSLGGSICFEMRYSIQGDASPCEGPDESDEGVYLQYSIDNGTTWTDINYWDPNGGNDPMLTSWNQYCNNLPAAAQTTATLIRWHQDDVSGAQYDHWGIDNVQITLNDPNAEITWLHDNYSYPIGSSGGENPNEVCLTNETTYVAQITNGTNTCIDSITIPIKLPTLFVEAGNDTSICASDCINLDGLAGVMINPGGSKTYANAQPDNTVSAFNVSSETNINVQNVNHQTIVPGLITSVCVDNFESSGTPFAALDEDSFTLTLTTPDGCSIELVPNGIANGPYSQVCFVPSGGNNLNNGSFPTPGNWTPNEPFSDLNGCSTNGSWNLKFEFSGPSGGIAELDGWSITFNDKDSIEAGIFSWSPTANMTDEDTFNPGVCPTTETTYTLTVVDSSGCVAPISDSVTVSISPCCNFDMNSTINEATCGNSDGDIDLIITNGSGNFTYDWGANGTNEDLMNLASGSYTVSITDVTEGCTEDTTIILTNSNDFSYTLNINNPTCGNADGLIEINTMGGTAPFMYSFDNGLTFSTNNSETLPAGTYTIIIQDNGGCEQTFTETLTQDCCNFNINQLITNTTCGSNNGAIDLTLTNNSGNESFAWSNGSTTEDISNLPAGNYEVTISSIGCSVVENFTVGTSNGVIANFSATPQPTTISNSEITMISQSSNATNFSWTIDGAQVGTDNDSLVYLFPSDTSGSYSVCLVASNNLCIDSTCNLIIIDNDSVAIVIPNVITPNNDGKNDLFKISGIEDKYSLSIFNRWGRKVKEFETYDNTWDGTNNGGNDLAEGTYFYVLKNKEDNSITFEGFLNLYR